MIRWLSMRERTFWVTLMALMVCGAAMASFSDVGPFIVFDTSGNKVSQLGTSGEFQGKAVKKLNSSTNLTIQASDATKRLSYDEQGVEALLNSGDQWGTVSVTAPGENVIQVNFDNAQTDNSYNVMLFTEGVTPTASDEAGPFHVYYKNANYFVISNPSLHQGPEISCKWRVYRTAEN